MILSPSNRLAFIGDRQIHDALLVANEVVEYTPALHVKGVVLKLDFEKTYDRVK